MEVQLGSSRTWSQRVFHSPRTRQWGYTQAYGMLMTGQQEVALWRLIGAKLHSQHHIGTSMPMPVSILEHHLALPTLPPPMPGSTNSWIQQAKTDWVGCRRITWFTITALTPIDFHKAFPQSAKHHDWIGFHLYGCSFFYSLILVDCITRNGKKPQ